LTPQQRGELPWRNPGVSYKALLYKIKEAELDKAS
jgi:hypothetical protein